MPNFKPKTKKKIKGFSKKSLTLDNKHTEKMKEFQNNKNVKIPKLKEKIKTIKEKIKNENVLEKKLDLKDELKDLKKKIKQLKGDEKSYLLNNSNYIFNYFEKKKNLSEGNSKKKILHSFFDVNSS